MRCCYLALEADHCPLSLPSVTGGLYLHPVNLQLQLRPNLDYLDALDEKNREEKRRDRAGGEDSEDEAEPAGPGAPPKKEEGKAVSVRRRHLPSPRSSCIRLTSR